MKCAYCGGDFELERPEQKYCGRPCANKARIGKPSKAGGKMSNEFERFVKAGILDEREMTIKRFRKKAGDKAKRKSYWRWRLSIVYQGEPYVVEDTSLVKVLRRLRANIFRQPFQSRRNAEGGK